MQMSVIQFNIFRIYCCLRNQESQNTENLYREDLGWAEGVLSLLPRILQPLGGCPAVSAKTLDEVICVDGGLGTPPPILWCDG